MASQDSAPVAVGFNHDLFAYETFEHEVIVLQTVDGTYYAFGGSAVNFWEDLVSGRSIARIVSTLEGTAEPDGPDIAGQVTSFVESLMQERIFLPAAAEAEGALRLGQTPATHAFAPPTIEKHVDMQDLLTLDPIHDIDLSKGWPHT